MKKTQLISTLLLIAMLAGCGSQGAGNDTTTSADNTDDTTTEAPASNEYPYETGRYDGQTFTFLNAEDELWAGSKPCSRLRGAERRACSGRRLQPRDKGGAAVRYHDRRREDRYFRHYRRYPQKTRHGERGRLQCRICTAQGRYGAG